MGSCFSAPVAEAQRPTSSADGPTPPTPPSVAPAPAGPAPAARCAAPPAACGGGGGGAAPLDVVAAAIAAVEYPDGFAPAAARMGVCAEAGAPFDPSAAGPPLPPCEAERLASIQALNILDSPPEPELNNILSLINSMFGTQAALIALFGDRRIWIKQSTGGFQAGDFPWHKSFCGWSMATPAAQPLVVPDAFADARFARHPLVKAGEVRFYAGAPLLTSSGHRIGTICCADPSPRVFDDRQCFILANFAEMVARQLERDVALAVQKHTAAALLKPPVPPQPPQQQQQQQEAAQAPASSAATPPPTPPRSSVEGEGAGGILCVDAADGRWQVVYATPAAEALLGSRCAEAAGRPLWDFIQTRGGAGARAALARAATTGQPFKLLSAVPAGPARGNAAYDLIFTPASVQGPLEPGAPPILLPTYIPEAPRDRTAAPDAVFFVTAHPAASPGGVTRCHPPARSASSDLTASAAAGVASGSNLSTPGDSSTLLPVFPSKRSFTQGHAAGGLNPCSGFIGIGGGRRSVGSTSGWGSSAHTLLKRSAEEAFEGLRLGPAIAAGSYGRVYKGHYHGTQVAVKVLEEDAITKRDPETGASLEAVLSHALAHPSIVRTLAWRIVHGRARVEKAPQLKGETLGTPVRPGLALLQEQRARASQRLPAAPSAASADSATAAAPPAAAPTAPPPPEHVRMEPLSSSTLGDTGDALGDVAGTGDALGDAGDTGDEVILLDGDLAEGARELLMGRAGLVGWGAVDTDCGGTEEPGQTWIVLEYCDKGCLQDAIDRGWLREDPAAPGVTAPDVLAVLATAREIAAGMAYLHSLGVVHGDLSAFNVMLSSSGEAARHGGRGWTAKVADFGLARVLDAKSRVLTKTYGTITHAAPEVLSHGLITRACDVYAWGVLLWQMCCGIRPWAGMGHAAVARAVACERRPLIFPPGCGTPEGLQMLAGAAMAWDPAERPSFAEIMEVLRPLEAALAAAAG